MIKYSSNLNATIYGRSRHYITREWEDGFVFPLCAAGAEAIIRGNYLNVLLFYSVRQLNNAAVLRRLESRVNITVRDHDENTALAVAQNMGDE